jgi:hypothetical protein
MLGKFGRSIFNNISISRNIAQFFRYALTEIKSLVYEISRALIAGIQMARPLALRGEARLRATILLLRSGSSYAI